MTLDVKMPKLGLTMTEGTVVRWLKEEGDHVEKGEPLLEIETDKVVLEVEAPETGMLKEILVRTGGAVEVGQPVATLTQADPLPRADELLGAKEIKATPVAQRMAEARGVDLRQLEGTGPRGRITAEDVRAAAEPATAESEHPRSRIRVSWRARSVAEEHGIDLSELVPGRGPRGRIVEKDVLAALEALTEEGAESQVREAAWEQLSAVERVTAERMAESFSTVPHFYLTVEIDAQELVDLRQALLPLVEERVATRLTFTDILVKATAVALREHPRVNGAWDDGRIRLNSSINVGIATATDRGLIVPVIEHADRKDLPEIAAERADLTARARQGHLSVGEVQRGSFTLSNLGAYGVDTFHPIINAPESSILAVGRIKERPTGFKGGVALRPTMMMTLACDHRVLDGARAAAFLQRVTELLEEPYALLAAGNLLESRTGGER